MNQTMEKLKKMEEREYSTLTRVLFGLDTPTSVPQKTADFDPELRDMDFIDKTLNDSQKDAVRFALASKEAALIHGPPGVGSIRYSAWVVLLMSPRLARRIR